MKKFMVLAYCALIGMLISALAIPVDSAELRKLGMRINTGLGVAGDIYFGNTCYLTPSPHFTIVCGLNMSHIPFFADNTYTGETLAPLAAKTPWRLFYTDNAGTLTPLVLGTVGYALTSGGASAAPTWSAGGAGDMTKAVYDSGNDGVVDSAIATVVQDNLIVNADINSAAGIVGSKLADNTIDVSKIKLNLDSGGYSLFLNAANRIEWSHYDNTATRVIRVATYDDGEFFVASYPSGATFSLGALGASAFSVVANSITLGAISNAELSYLDLVTSPIQTQLNAKGDVVGPSSDTTGYLAVIDNTGKVISRGPCYVAGDNTLICSNGFSVPQDPVIPGDLKMYELSGNGTNYVGYKAPDNVTETYQLVMPPAKGTVGQSRRLASDNVTEEWYTPASGGTKAFDFVFGAPASTNNTAIKTLPTASTIAEIGGIFTDSSGDISTTPADNVAVQLSFCSPDNVANCVSIDNTTIVGGTSVYSDVSMGGTAAVPAKSPIVLKFGTINTSKPFKITIYYTED